MKKDGPQKLIFVYNANSGRRNAWFDSAHKILSPATYSCSLCDLTYGVFKENGRWKRFREKSDTAMEFLHKDEFAKQYASKFGSRFEFPIILADTGTELEVFIGKKELDSSKTVHELIGKIKDRL